SFSRDWSSDVCSSDLPWNSRMLTQRLMRAGMEVVEIPQNMKHLSPAMKMIETLMKRGMMTHEPHPVARWCWGNVVVAVDGNENKIGRASCRERCVILG